MYYTNGYVINLIWIVLYVTKKTFLIVNTGALNTQKMFPSILTTKFLSLTETVKYESWILLVFGNFGCAAMLVFHSTSIMSQEPTSWVEKVACVLPDMQIPGHEETKNHPLVLQFSAQYKILQIEHIYDYHGEPETRWIKQYVSCFGLARLSIYLSSIILSLPHQVPRWSKTSPSPSSSSVSLVSWRICGTNGGPAAVWILRSPRSLKPCRPMTWGASSSSWAWGWVLGSCWPCLSSYPGPATKLRMGR